MKALCINTSIDDVRITETQICMMSCKSSTTLKFEIQNEVRKDVDGSCSARHHFFEDVDVRSYGFIGAKAGKIDLYSALINCLRTTPVRDFLSKCCHP